MRDFKKGRTVMGMYLRKLRAVSQRGKNNKHLC
jgi:hypothetical protein